MPLIAITREISPDINDCELSFHERQPIDLTLAMAQHRAYRDCLTDLGAKVVSLPAEPGLPDAVFVEDPAIVLDEVAIISNMGAASRRPEATGLAKVLANYRPLKFITNPAPWMAATSCRWIVRFLSAYRSEQTWKASNNCANC